jgi:hypothetical protein
MSEEVKKSRGKDPEFMQMMRQKAAAKKAEQKKIKDAEALRAEQAHEAKLKEADDILNPKPAKPVKQQPEPEVAESDGEEEVHEEVNLHKTIKKGLKPLGNEPNYKQMYYRAKLEKLASTSAQPAAPQYNGYDIARHNIVQSVNKNLMTDLLKQYYPSG